MQNTDGEIRAPSESGQVAHPAPTIESHMTEQITFDQFLNVDIRVGTVTDAQLPMTADIENDNRD